MKIQRGTGISRLADCLDGKTAKLLLAVLAFSLLFRFPLMDYVFGLFAVQEVILAVMNAAMPGKYKNKCVKVRCGTAVPLAGMLLLILLPEINIFTANLCIFVCMGFMLYSFIFRLSLYLYMGREPLAKAGRMKKRKRFLITAGVACAACAYLVLGATLPYREQPTVREEFKEGLNPDSFYSEEVSCDRAMVIKENGAALDERLRMIANARERIILSSFAFQSDDSGKDMLAALYDAAKRGVEIKILADGFNSWTYMEYNPYFYVLSSMPEVEIKLYNKVNLLTPWTSMGRMHDKYIIADEAVYILGGRNTFNYSLGDYGGNKNHDWDVLVYNTGGTGSTGSVYQLKKYFYDIWNLEYSKLFHDSEALAGTISVRRAAEELAKRYEDIRESRPDLFMLYNYEEVTSPTNRIKLISNPTGIYPKEPACFYTLVQLMKNAREQAYIHTPYVICNNAMYRAFVEVAADDVSLKLMTNSVANNGNLFAAGDYLENKETLLQTGIDIWEYDGGVSYHGKCIAIDNDMSVIGSFNMDMRSVYLNTELMLAIHSRELNKELREQMASYEEKAMHVAGADSYEENGGHVKQELSVMQGLKIKAIRFIIGWARFLL